MQVHTVQLKNGTAVNIEADKIKTIGPWVYKMVGPKWSPIYKDSEVTRIYVNRGKKGGTA